MLLKIKYIVFLILFSTLGYAQQNSLSKAAGKVSESLEKNKSDEELAEDYRNLAKELVNKQEYAKAEEYLVKAKNLYSKNKKRKEVASVSRDLAKVQESQKKYGEAIKNYDNASQNAVSPSISQLNANDISRLQNAGNKAAQKKYIQNNIELSKELPVNEAREEKVVAYQQLAEVEVSRDKKDVALENLSVALTNTTSKTEETAIRRQIAGVYAASNQIDKAIDVNKKLAEEAKKSKDSKTEIEQLQILSDLYLETNNQNLSIKLLEDAYNLALKQGRTLDAKQSLEKLIKLYEQKGDKIKSLQLYNDFMSKLEFLIKSDNSLIDSKVFEITEGKIKQLEKEKSLQEELIKQQNIINYVLIALLAIIVVSTIFIIRSLYKIKEKNKKIALQSLRREMNPHFIFNSLNSVNHFIAQNRELEANKYLSSYSKLMRNVMENSNKDFIKLSTELEQLKEYLDLEELRFHEKFSYEIFVDESIDSDAIFIPNMLIQPNLENAIWHGLRYKKEKGFLKLSFVQKDENIVISIEDNGIGIEESNRLKTRNQKLHKSRGLTNSRERISLLKELYKINIDFSVQDKRSSEKGVIVQIILPVLNTIKTQ